MQKALSGNKARNAKLAVGIVNLSLPRLLNLSLRSWYNLTDSFSIQHGGVLIKSISLFISVGYKKKKF